MRQSGFHKLRVGFMSIWFRLAISVTFAALLSAALGWFTQPMVGWALIAGFLLSLVIDQLRQLQRVRRWVMTPGETPPPAAFGVGQRAWDDVLSSWYHESRNQQRRLERLNHTLEGFREAAQALPDGVLILNNEDRIEWANAIAQVHLGLQLPNDLGQVVTNLLRTPEFGQYLRHGPWQAPFVFKIEIGRPRTLVARLIRYGQTQRLLMSRDITQVERLETMRRDFVANVSHELRTPLTVLSGFLETLRELPAEAISPEQHQHYLTLMFDQAQRMQSLVSDLLTLSSLESTTPPTPNRVRIAFLVSTLQPQVEALSAGAHRFHWNIDPHLDVRGIESELNSAFSNLLSNAVRYSPNGGDISVRWQRNAQGQAVFSVRDTGLGIAPQHIPRLTERFYRVDRGRSRESGGTGLGLAIVKHIALRHYAELHIDSTVGQGSLFSLNFDVSVIVPSTPATPTSSEEPTPPGNALESLSQAELKDIKS